MQRDGKKEKIPYGVKRYKCRDCGNWGYTDGNGDFICPNHNKDNW